MSCVAGLFNTAGGPVDPDAVSKMLDCMRDRAPDGQQIYGARSVAFGLQLLRTGTSAAEAMPPLSLDNRVWLVADCRIDGRAELVRRLRSEGRSVCADASHGELILHAYHAFGEKFTDHLIGDFAFALWDAGSNTLICARDHFGIRPFFYFRAGDLFGFASTLDALLTVPGSSGRLDRTSVVDFLLFGADQDPERTIYRDISCLAPAHKLIVSPSGSRQERYWSLPTSSHTRRSTMREYVEDFGQLLEQAVADRLPSGPVAIQMSGGMDSTSIAAVAAERAPAITAYNLCCKSVLPADEERHYAKLAAAHLGIRLVTQDVGAYPLFGNRGGARGSRTSTPVAYPHMTLHSETMSLVEQSGARVLLSGHGGDAILRPSSDCYAGLLRRGRFRQLALEVTHHVRHTRSLAGMGLRSALWPRAQPTPDWQPALPDWIHPRFADRDHVQSRWEKGWNTYHAGVDAPRQLQQSWLSRAFETVEALGRPVVFRYPLYDLRLVSFVMGLPNFAVQDKFVMRESMRGKLPAAVTQRPKFGLQGDVFREMVVKGGLQSDEIGLPPMVEPESFKAAWHRYYTGEGVGSNWQSVLMLTPLALRVWLAQCGPRSTVYDTDDKADPERT